MRLSVKRKNIKTNELKYLSYDFINDKIEYLYLKLKLEGVVRQLIYELANRENAISLDGKYFTVLWKDIYDIIQFILSISETALDSSVECPTLLSHVISKIILEVAHIPLTNNGQLKDTVEFYLREDWKKDS